MHSAWICCVPSFSQQGMVQHAFHAPSTWQVFAEGDPVSLHHQLDMDADKLLDPIALATIEGACIVSPSIDLPCPSLSRHRHLMLPRVAMQVSLMTMCRRLWTRTCCT